MSGHAKASAPAAMVLKIRVRPGVEREFSSWHAKMSTAASGMPGFVSAEVDAPTAPSWPEWRIILHFQSVEQSRAWRESEPHRQLILEAESLVDGTPARGLSVEEVAENQSDVAAIEVITTRVKSGQEEAYRQWAARIHQAEARFPGYRGALLQPPVSPGQQYWTALIRFKTQADLITWMTSDVRRALLREHHAMVESWKSHLWPSSFSSWFPAGSADRQAPAEWKQSMIMLLMLFPIVMLERLFLSPWFDSPNAAVPVFIRNTISVALITWPLMPLTIRVLNWWLTPQKGAHIRIDLMGLAAVLSLYAVEIAAFWHALF